ncbi:MAG: response regulator [Isosphaeraceae bacterium]
MSPLESSGTAGTTRVRILLVEDNEAASKGLARLLEASGYDVTSATTGEEALAHLQGSPPDFLLTDLQLPDIDGRELALKARELSPPPRVILITGWDVEADE